MVRLLLFVCAVVTGGSASAASKNPFSAEFYSLSNTDFVVSIGFLLFIGLLAYLGVQKMIFSALDDRSERIRAELEEARKLKEDAQKLLGDFQRKQSEVQEHAERIVEAARQEAHLAAEQAKEDIARSVARRMAAAQEQIAAAEVAVMKEVRERAISVATKAARQVFTEQLSAAKANSFIDEAILEVEKKLH